MDIRSNGEPARFVVGVGASAGGIEALTRLVRSLPDDLQAAILIVLHVPAAGPSLLPEILSRHTALAIAQADEGDPLLDGRILVAPPDRHLVVADGHVRLERGPKENNVRPAVDPLLRSIAASFGPRSIAIILSGALGDGSGGARAVAAAGGRVLVQDPADAVVMSMPQRALQAVGDAATVAGADAIGKTLGALVRGGGFRHHCREDIPA